MVPHADPVAISLSFDFVLLSQSVNPAAGTPLQYLGTFVSTWLIAAIMAYVAAQYVLGDTPAKLALAVGIGPALVVTLLIRWPVWVIFAAFLAVDVVAFHLIYRVRYRTAIVCSIIHFSIVVIVGFALSTLLVIILG